MVRKTLVVVPLMKVCLQTGTVTIGVHGWAHLSQFSSSVGAPCDHRFQGICVLPLCHTPVHFVKRRFPHEREAEVSLSGLLILSKVGKPEKVSRHRDSILSLWPFISVSQSV